MPMRPFFLILFLSCLQALSAQTAQLSGIINQYAAITGYDSCAARLSVSDTTGFEPGTDLLLLHLQGSQINAENSASYGTITEIRQAGRLEKARIVSRAQGSLFLENRLRYPVIPSSIAQVVTYPTYQNAVVIDTIKALPWDGQKGGVIAFRVEENLTLNAPISADHAGFRGGTSYLAPTNNCTWLVPEVGYFYGAGNWRGGVKGEGIALGNAAQELGRGAPANAGGGGNDHNSGGGGGGNTGTGGAGGDNDEPSAFGCDGYYPGLGGKSLAIYTNRLFLGGGGGSGHTNNSSNSDGGNGGGIIVVEANQVTGSTPILSASGENGKSTAGDGAGGGGAGGSIWLKANSVPSNIQLHCTGGRGGNASGSGANRCFGPGGGGGGGLVTTNLTSPLTQLQGGAAGTVTNSSSACNGSTNDAQNGQNGAVSSIFILETGQPLLLPPTPVNQPLADTICEGENTTLVFELINWNGPVQWQSQVGSNWVNLPNAQSPSLTVSPSSSTTYRCWVDGADCFQLFSDEVTVLVQLPPQPAFSLETVDATTIQLYNTSQNYTGQEWNFGDGSLSTEENPQHTYLQNGIYEVTLKVYNACDTLLLSQEVLIELPPIAQFSGPEEITACNAPVVSFQNESQGAMSFLWTFEGGSPSSSSELNPSVQYNSSGTFMVTLIVQNGAGTDTLSNTITVELLPFPEATFTWTAQPNGIEVQFTFTGSNALLYNWNFGDGSAGSTEASPVHVFPGPGVYPVRLVVQNTCGASVLEVVVIVSDEGVNSQEAPSGIWSLHPNPTSDQISIRVDDATGWIQLYSQEGKKLEEVAFEGPGNLRISLAHYPAGNYWVVLRTQHGYRWTLVAKQ